MSSNSKPSTSSHSSSVSKGIHEVLNGRVGLVQAAREGFRRGRAAFTSRRERELIEDLASRPAQLTHEFQNYSPDKLLQHFRKRDEPAFFPGFEAADFMAQRQRELFKQESEDLIAAAQTITNEHRWSLLGFSEQDFGRPINWHRDPLSERIWPLDYHKEIELWRHDGSDIRVLWELNRLGHLLTLGRAYVLTKDELLAEEFFNQIESWNEQNPLGRGANWACAMEVALRAINLLTAFTLFKSSPRVNEQRLLLLLKLFDQHGAHIRRNLEFSYIATSNHYLSDVAGILWIAIMLPELQAAEAWRNWALAELLREMDEQILDDGADYEGATAYHRFVLQLFLYSFFLCRINAVSIPDRYWAKLHSMLAYLRQILRPDGTLPLIGDSDDSTVWFNSNERHPALATLQIGAAIFKDAKLKFSQPTTQLLWALGEEGLRDYEALGATSEEGSSNEFPDAGIYVLRHQDLSLLFNAGRQKPRGPTSHRHNDLSSIDVSAYGRAFIVDPGTYVYTANLEERHRFRSTEYHSTLQIDGEEQQTIRESEPFKIGAEARIRVLSWESNAKRDRIVAEHEGYARLSEPVTHRRAVTFDKTNRWWLIEDELTGRGNHLIASRFHFDAELEVSRFDAQTVASKDAGGAQLFVCALSANDEMRLTLEPQFVSRNYGSKMPSTTACWSVQADVPLKLRWAIVPVGAEENLDRRLGIVQTSKSFAL